MLWVRPEVVPGETEQLEDKTNGSALSEREITKTKPKYTKQNMEFYSVVPIADRQESRRVFLESVVG